jgi:PKD repeat protein
LECDTGGLSAGLQLTFSQQTCADGGGVCSATTASFTASPTSGLAPLTVTFTNLSTGATNYSWGFGDGNTSTATNPLNTYSNSGAFSVSLTAIGPGGTNAFTATNYIVVNLRPSLVPSPLSGTNFVFSFQTLAGKTYTIEYKDSLTTRLANAANCSRRRNRSIHN